MIQSYIAQLRASLGEMKPVSEARLRELFGRQDYTSMVKVIRDKMGLDLRVRVGVVNEGGPVGAPAWVSAPKPMPRFGTAEFQQTLVTVFLRKTFVSSHNFEEVAIAIAHELSHIVLFGINHSLQECEEAVDLTAMLLGYRDLYIAGSFCEVRPASFWGRLSLFIEKRVTGVERRTYRTFGYLTPEEVKYAAVILAMPSGSFNVNTSKIKSSARWAFPPIAYSFAVVAIMGFAAWISSPTTTKPALPKLVQNACATRPQPNEGVYARYDQSPSVAPLTLRTASGSNYFVKIADAVNGRPILSFYVFGGSTFRVEVPAGSFILKYATGDNWCGDRELFGASTEIIQTDRIFQFDYDHGYKIDLIRRREGNLPAKQISPRIFLNEPSAALTFQVRTVESCDLELSNTLRPHFRNTMSCSARCDMRRRPGS